MRFPSKPYERPSFFRARKSSAQISSGLHTPQPSVCPADFDRFESVELSAKSPIVVARTEFQVPKVSWRAVTTLRCYNTGRPEDDGGCERTGERPNEREEGRRTASDGERRFVVQSGSLSVECTSEIGIRTRNPPLLDGPCPLLIPTSRAARLVVRAAGPTIAAVVAPVYTPSGTITTYRTYRTLLGILYVTEVCLGVA
ncbi:hypothetical protein ALC60_12541 [Trachymyrmex zeteki]|uniref:Uncharacterized protein n=1 Tax=Mycetomoellerius zeteki TaxID=64791 RepID=A0A151WL47_9HYME|nr:hypothetical protein ALC60_12541 [Trachymyrmex zeteki]